MKLLRLRELIINFCENLLIYIKMKEQILCFQIPIKTSNQIAQFKKRQDNYIPGTPKIILGKLHQGIQQIWTQQFKCQKVSFLKNLYSNQLAFDLAILIVSTVKDLIKFYGYFILNENMVFHTKSKKHFIWINPDIFANTSKIYLDQAHQGQQSMIKGLINYFKLWLQTQYSALSQIKTLKQFAAKLQQLKRQKLLILSKDANLVTFFQRSSTDSEQKIKLYESTKGIVLKKQSQQLPFKNNNPNNSKSSSRKHKCLTSKCFNYSQQLGTEQKEQASQASKISSESQGKKSSFTNSFSKKASNSFRNIPKKNDEKKFPNKTTSSTLQIVQKIKLQDQNPDHYPSNKILISNQKQLIKEQQNRNRIKLQLGGINEELDNLFLSNIESEGNQEAAIQREKEFQEILRF